MRNFADDAILLGQLLKRFGDCVISLCTSVIKSHTCLVWLRALNSCTKGNIHTKDSVDQYCCTSVIIENNLKIAQAVGVNIPIFDQSVN